MILHSGYTGELDSGGGVVDIGDNTPYSLMLDSGVNQYLSRTFVAPTSNTSWCLSEFEKLGKLGVAMSILSAGDSDIRINASNQLEFFKDGAIVATSTAFERDPTGHGHLYVRSNGTNVKGYWNTAEIVSYTGTMPDINSAVLHTFGRYQASATNYFDGYRSLPIFVDGGGALTPQDFVRQSVDSGQWVNRNTSPTYGNNGFKLEFADPSFAAYGLGKDTSGNNNHWTPQGGITSANQYTDTPTNNYCVLNPLTFQGNGAILSKGNLRLTAGAAYAWANGTLSVNAGKWYWGATVTQAPYSPRGGGTQYYAMGLGLASVTGASNSLSVQTTALAIMDSGYYKNFSGANTDFGSAVANGDELVLAVDLDANTFTIYQNGTSRASGTIGMTQGTLVTPIGTAYGSTYGVMVHNYGQKPLVSTALETTLKAAGFKALNTANLPTPAIPDPTKHHYVVTVAKSGNTNFTLPWDASVYDTRFKIKRRDAAGSHAWIDGLRGYDKVLFSDTTAAEITDANYIGVSGTTITLKSSLPDGSYLIIADKAGLASARQTNTNGSITSTVSANQLSGFSIVIYAGTSANATVGHGLLKAPEMVTVKKRDVSGTTWMVQHKALSNAANVLTLNTTDAQAAYATGFNSAFPTSTVFSLGTGAPGNELTKLHVAYCHHSVEGYSKFFGSTHNAAADGTFDNCGIKPTDITTKCYSTTGNWFSLDDKRDPYNVGSGQLYLNTNGAEVVTATLDRTATGVKYRTASDPNAAQSYINCIYGYPTKYSTAV